MRKTSLLLGLALLIPACADAMAAPDTGSQPAPPVIRPVAPVLPPAETADACNDLLDYYIRTALEQVGPWGLDGYPAYEIDRLIEPMADGGREAAADFAPEAPGTNNQVSGVDEADRVKTDGSHIFSVVDNTVEIARIDDGGVTLVGSIDIGFSPWSLLLYGDRLVALGGGTIDRFPVEPMIDVWVPPIATTQLVEIDISNPDRPKTVRTLTVDGNLVGARLIEGTAQVALSSRPLGFEWATPSGSGLRAETEALEENRRLVNESTLDNWLPWYRLADADDDLPTDGLFTDCSRVAIPGGSSDLTTVTVATFDLEREGLAQRDTAGVVGQASTYYAATGTTYLAAPRWDDPRAERFGFAPPQTVRTEIHAFDTRPGQLSHLGSGSVPGTLIGQFALDAHDGVLRVASTVENWDVGASESMVTTLDGATLSRLGQVSGLGKGEQIYSVRFVHDMGYVVTFRQIDPLYTLDLSDPFEPEAAGELKITGYSSYLHPVGDGLLLGVGQEADTNGRLEGTQVSLFDVTDPFDPSRLDQIHLRDASSEVEWDHHAFTYVDGLALVPVMDHDEAGTLAVQVKDDQLRIEGTLQAPPTDGGKDWALWRSSVRRTIVTPELVIGVGDDGLSVWDRSGYEWIEFESFRR